MTTKRNPEERPARGAAAAGGAPAQPTGDEVFERTAETAPPEPAPEGVEEGRTQLQQIAAEYYENLTVTAAELSRQAGELYDTGTRAVSSNPWIAIGAAAGAGLMIGLLMDGQ